MRMRSLLLRMFVSMLALAVTLSASPAEAAPILSVQPSATAVAQGETLSVLIGIGLIDPTSADDVSDLYAYQFGVSFDPSIFVVNSVTEGSFLGQAGQTFFIPGLVDNVGGTVTFNANTLLGASPGATGAGWLLGLELTALNPGISAIAITFDALNGDALLDSGLNAIDEVTALGASVTVGGGSTTPPATVPEPSTLLLLGTGGIAALVRSRQKFGRPDRKRLE